MRILVGTLYSGENEFDDCCKSVTAQSYQNCEQIVIEGLGKAEAHDRLYSIFMHRAAEFDLLVKLDADMIIQDRNLFDNVVRAFQEDEELDWLSVPCFDFLVGENLGEMNVYRNTIKWEKNIDNLFTDRTHNGSTIRKRRKWTVLSRNPKIIHCGNPSCFHSFHFGYHRTLKALAKGKVRSLYRPRNWKVMRRVAERYEESGDIRLLYVVAGADCAIRFDFGDESTSYANDQVRKEFDAYKDAIQSEQIGIRNLKAVKHLMRIPFPWDYRILFFYHRIKSCLRFKRH